MLDRSRFATLWCRLGARNDGAEVFERLRAAYDEPHRAYHTATHIVKCLAFLDEPPVRALAARPDEVEAALWFHDAVYDTRAGNNEERSATMASESMRVGAIANEVSSRVADMVRATRNHFAPSPDGALVIDIDLSILGAGRDEFDRFDAQIRHEYGWVEEAVYRAGRAGVLRRFLDRPFIYNAPLLRERFEAAARANLQRALGSLEGGGP